MKQADSGSLDIDMTQKLSFLLQAFHIFVVYCFVFDMVDQVPFWTLLKLFKEMSVDVC